MKKPLASFLSVLALSLLTACSSGDSAAVGVYHLDVEALKASVPEMKEMPAGMKFEGVLDLKADHSVTLKMGMGPMMSEPTGTWKLDGQTITLTMKEKDGKEEPKSGKFKDGAITLEEDMGGKKLTMVFKKK